MKNIAPTVAQIIRQFAQETRQLLRENLIAEYLFGSYATDTQTALSDIDILILVRQATPDLQRQISGLASDYSLMYDLYISPMIEDMTVWEKNQRCQTLFYRNVMQQGIPL